MQNKFIGPRPRSLNTERFFDGDPQLGESYGLPYGKRVIGGEVVHHIGGFYREGIDMIEAVLRTKAGHYFLAREVYAESANYMEGYTPPAPAFAMPQGTYWLRIKRLTLKAALLMSTKCVVGSDLMSDALEAMKPQATTDEGENVTVPLTLPMGLYRQILAMGAYDGDANIGETIVDDMEGDVTAWLESGGLAKRNGRPNPARFLQKFERELDAGLHPDVYPPSLVFPVSREGEAELPFLDDHCRELVRGYLAARPDLDPRDVVNAAVEFFTCDPDDMESVDSSREAMARAMARRTTGNPTPLAVKPLPVPILKADRAQKDDGCQHFTFSYPPKAKRCGLRHMIKLNAEQMNLAQTLAPQFGLDVPAFLKKLVGRSLPGQPGQKRADRMQAKHLTLAIFDPAMEKRIERAALARRKTWEAFVAEAIGGNVEALEEMMIVHPQTGALLCEDLDDVFTRVDMDVTAPPRNGSWVNFLVSPQREAGKQFVRLEAWLSPEELAQMHGVRVVRDPSRLPFLQLPIPPESEPRLTVDGRGALLDLAPPEVEPVAMAARETKPPGANGERRSPAKPVFMLNAPKPKLPKKSQG